MPVPADAVTSATFPSRSAWPCGYSGAGISDNPSLWLWFAGQAQRALADDVALDLVRSAVDRVGSSEQEQCLLAGELVRRTRAEQRRHALHVHGQLAELLVPGGPRQL